MTASQPVRERDGEARTERRMARVPDRIAAVTAAPSRYETLPAGHGSAGVYDTQTRQWVPGAAFTGRDARKDAEDELTRIREGYAHGRTPRAPRERGTR